MSTNTGSPNRIFIGYDPREVRAYDVCKNSLKYTTLSVHKLFSEDIEEYSRDWGEVQSTDFTFTRFMVPYLSEYQGWSFFVDCDFLFLADPGMLIENFDDSKAVYCCQHPGYIPNSQIKMDGIPQHRAYRKNWASFIAFNNADPSTAILTPEYVNNHRPGLDFHQLRWLKDEEIGSIPLEWNCLDDYYHLEHPKAIHYTDGGPWFEDYQDTFYGDLWKEAEHNLLLERLDD